MEVCRPQKSGQKNPFFSKGMVAIAVLCVLCFGIGVSQSGHVISAGSSLKKAVFSAFRSKPSKSEPTSAAVVRYDPQEVQTLIIDIKQKDYQWIRFKRQEALERGSIQTSEDAYVPVKVSSGGKMVKAKMRLKGDITNHLEGKKWSFRIKISGNNTVFGMKRFSIQDPQRSGWIKEWMYHQWLRHEGLIGLRYEFIHVVINGEDMGVHALEESFAKELVEANQRREAPLLKFDEAALFDSSLLGGADSSSQEDVFKNAAILSFRESKVLKRDDLRERYLHGRNLLNGLRQGKLSLEQVVEIEKAGALFAIAEVLNAYHSLRWKNVRFYVDPLSNRLELIGYNAFNKLKKLRPVHLLRYTAWASKQMPKTAVASWYGLFFNNREFLSAYFGALHRFTEKGYLESFMKKISYDFQRYNQLIADDGGEKFYPKYLYNNRNKVRSLLTHKSRIHAQFEGFDQKMNTLALSLANPTLVPLIATKVSCAKSKKTWDFTEPTFLPVRGGTLVQRKISGFNHQDYLDCVKEAAGSQPELSLPDLTIQYHMVGQDRLTYTASIDTFPLNKFGSVRQKQRDVFLALAQHEHLGHIEVDEGSKLIALLPGKWTLTSDLVLPAGYRVQGQPGLEINLTKGAAIISYAQLKWSGTKERPIKLTSSDGSGQGLIVLSVKPTSYIEHVQFEGMRPLTRPGWSLTGGVTFYSSPVSMSHVSFVGGHSEDVLNLVLSPYEIRNGAFEKSESDMVDADFSDGIIADSSFRSCGNDCIDISGSKAEFTDLHISGAGDKGISVGENSRGEVKKVKISEANIGLASKDKSQAILKKLTIEKSNIALAAYQKKPEFGGATIRAEGLAFEDVRSLYQTDAVSSIFIEGEKVHDDEAAEVRAFKDL